MSPQRSVPQNVNFAIGSPVVTNFLVAKGVQPKVGSAEFASRAALTQPDIADLAKRFTVQVLCKGVNE